MINAGRRGGFAKNVVQYAGRKNNPVRVDVATHEIDNVGSFTLQFFVKGIKRVLCPCQAVREGREAHGIYFAFDNSS
jgi:hypothetical protein